MELSGLVRTTRIPNLWAIPAGTLPPNPPALLARPDLGTALAQLKRHYRWVLVDSPPVAAVTDALLLAQNADATVLVVQQNKVDRAMVKRAARRAAQGDPQRDRGGAERRRREDQGLLRLRVLRLPEGPPGEERGPRAAGQAPARPTPPGGGDRCVHRLGGGAWPRGALLVLLAAPAAARGRRSALALARLSLVERKVELAKKGATWQAAVEGGPLPIGEALRTGPDAVARLELPWMALTLGPGSTLRFPDAFLLSASLESGRALVEAQGRDALKIVTAEAEVRGQGRAVVRRQGRRRSSPASPGASTSRAASRPSLSPPAAARSSAPAARRRRPRTCRRRRRRACGPGRTPSTWPPGSPSSCAGRATPRRYQLELLPVGSDVVLLQRDVTASPARIEVPWEGAFRWRVSARDARAASRASPSEDGLIAVDASDAAAAERAQLRGA